MRTTKEERLKHIGAINCAKGPAEVKDFMLRLMQDFDDLSSDIPNLLDALKQATNQLEDDYIKKGLDDRGTLLLKLLVTITCTEHKYE